MARRPPKPHRPASAPSRAAIYHRVSSEEQVEGYSLDAQQRATKAYCEAHDWEIVREYRDEGKSAWTDDLAKRPAFLQMITDAEAGHVDVVVVHKLDRFSRNLITTLETLQRLEAVSVGFVSISEAMDFTTPIGKVILATLGAFAEYYSANLSAETRKGKSERKKQGLYNGVLPFGTTKGSDGVPIPHPDTHAGLVLAFELAAAGKTDREVAQALNAAGYRTSGNRGANPFTKDTVRPMLRNRFYLGELPDGDGGWIPGRHTAVIDEQIFLRVETARTRNAKRPRRVASVRSPWSLSGLATCAWCGAPMTAAGRAADGRQRAQCQGRVQGRGCMAPSVWTASIDRQLDAVLNGFRMPTTTRTQAVARWHKQRSRQTDTASERRRLQTALERARTLYLEGDLDEAAYRQRRADLQSRLAILPETTDDDDAVGERLAAWLADLSVAWRAAVPAERNRIARELFDGVRIERGTLRMVRPRATLLPFFETLQLAADDQQTAAETDEAILKNTDAAEGKSPAASGGVVNASTQSRKRRDSNPRSQP